MPDTALHCRVAILGGGPAGCATALALAGLGVDGVVVVEAGHYDAVRVGETLPPESRTLLGRLGVLDAFLADGHEAAFGNCSSWGSDDLGYNDFVFNPYGHGWHLDRRRFDALLAARAAAAGAQVLTDTRFEGVERHPGGLLLDLARISHHGPSRGGGGARGCKARGERPTEAYSQYVEGGRRRVTPQTRADPPPQQERGEKCGLGHPGGGRRRLAAELAVDATGSRAVLARAMGARRVFLDRLISVYGFLDLPPEAPFAHLTLLEAVEYGWWYAARLPGGRLAAAVASDGETVRATGLSRTPGWRSHLAATRHLAPALAAGRLDGGGLRAWPAHSFRLDRPAGERWLAVGDAASAYDPISGQGIHKALAGGLSAAEALHGRLAGEPGAFDEYAVALGEGFARYAAHRVYFYARETRWPEAPFWRRRRERGRDQ